MAKQKRRLIVKVDDHNLLDRIEMIPKPHRGKVVERALAVYLESPEGSEVFGLFQGQAPSANHIHPSGKTRSLPGNLLKKVMGDY